MTNNQLAMAWPRTLRGGVPFVPDTAHLEVTHYLQWPRRRNQDGHSTFKNAINTRDVGRGP